MFDKHIATNEVNGISYIEHAEEIEVIHDADNCKDCLLLQNLEHDIPLGYDTDAVHVRTKLNEEDKPIQDTITFNNYRTFYKKYAPVHKKPLTPHEAYINFINNRSREA